jgi:hypothetical protein
MNWYLSGVVRSFIAVTFAAKMILFVKIPEIKLVVNCWRRTGGGSRLAARGSRLAARGSHLSRFHSDIRSAVRIELDLREAQTLQAWSDKVQTNPQPAACNLRAIPIDCDCERGGNRT